MQKFLIKTQFEHTEAHAHIKIGGYRVPVTFTLVTYATMLVASKHAHAMSLLEKEHVSFM